MVDEGNSYPITHTCDKQEMRPDISRWHGEDRWVSRGPPRSLPQSVDIETKKKSSSRRRANSPSKMINRSLDDGHTNVFFFSNFPLASYRHALFFKSPFYFILFFYLEIWASFLRSANRLADGTMVSLPHPWFYIFSNLIFYFFLKWDDVKILTARHAIIGLIPFYLFFFSPSSA